MRLDPGFLNHWKTELLIDRLGADGVLAVLRLWGNAQIRRQWKGLQMTPKRLAMETKWKGDENHLFSTLTDTDAPWLDLAEDGTYSIHGFETHQKQVIHLWEAGPKGGRPKKVSLDSSKGEAEEEYSSSYPICKANGNQMVLETGKQGKSQTMKPPTIEQAISAGSGFGVSSAACREWWNARESTGWTIASGGTVRAITNWQSDLSRSKGWAEDQAKKNKKSDWKDRL